MHCNQDFSYIAKASLEKKIEHSTEISIDHKPFVKCGVSRKGIFLKK